MKRFKLFFIHAVLTTLILDQATVKADEIGDAMTQAQENPNEEEQISHAIEQEQQFEQDNGGGILTEVPEGEVGHDQLAPDDTHVELDPELPSENLSGEDQFIANKEMLQGGVSDEADAEAYIITMNSHNELVRLKNFKAISQDMKVFEENYRKCLQKIPSIVWSEPEIEKCVGPDFTQIVNDVNFERAKIKDRAAISLRQVIIKECYEKAGADEIQSDACDGFETDLMKMLWNQMNIYKMMVFNRDKYLFVYGRMPQEVFDEMMLKIKPIDEDLSHLIDEVEAYRDLIVVRIKQFVDDRTKSIVQLADYNKRNGVEAIKTYDLHITQTVKDNGISVASLPSNVRQDATVDHVFEESPYPDMDEAIENLRSANLKDVYQDSHAINFDEGDKGPQQFVVNQLTGEDAVPLKRKLLRSTRHYARKRAEIRKMELMNIKRKLALKSLHRRRFRNRHNLV